MTFRRWLPGLEPSGGPEIDHPSDEAAHFQLTVIAVLIIVGTMNLDRAQLDYCRAVLGLERVLVPRATLVAQYQGQDSCVEKTVEIRGALTGARVLALVPLEKRDFPLHGEADQLLEKMLLAMKLKPNEVAMATWQADANLAVPEEIAQLANSAGTRPIVVFGGQASAQSIAETTALGEWGVWGDSRILATYSPRELLQSPDQKRLAWVHLQAVMKHL